MEQTKVLRGYVLKGPDNGSHAISVKSQADVCPDCGIVFNPHDCLDDTLHIKRRCYDLSFTYDNFAVVSLKFKEFCLRTGYSNLEFWALPMDPDFCIIRPQEVLEFDSAARRTRFVDLCESCGRHFSTVGASPAFLRGASRPLPDGFFRSDLEFGSGNERNPLVIVGVPTRALLQREHLRGLEYQPIKNSH